jgi:cytoskeletal protein CcmA (bactofilin family)
MAHTAPRSSACTIGSQITVRGALSGEEDLLVEGRIEGSVSLSGHLIVAAGGVLQADIEVESIEVHGQVDGDIVASRAVTIDRGAHVSGNVRAPRIIIHDGAHFRGAVDMNVDLPEKLHRSAAR